jgi:2-phosphosulfolactate phosphatase
MFFEQAEDDIRFEWGERGAALLAPISDVVIVVDVLSFTTCVEIATAQGAMVYPYRWKDATAEQFANTITAQVADRQNPNGYSLSPASLVAVPADTRLVLPSPNGSAISLLTGSTPTLAGCLRNARAVAAVAARMGRTVAVIAAGERWEDGSLRPCLEDLVGAGAIIRGLPGVRSPEAAAAVAAYDCCSVSLVVHLMRCGSGREKIARGEAQDVELAAATDVSACVPILTDGAFIKLSDRQ